MRQAGIGYNTAVRRPPLASTLVLGLAILIAFAVRVIPNYPAVMTAAGVNFQDNDSWYHMRVVHNIAAHFPRQSGIDPYAVLPGGKNAYTDPWDLAIAAVAWLLALGTPSDWLLDQVGAWLPPILGALLPIPVFLLARRLLGESAARWSAFAMAVVPGTLVWATHLGIPDHHVAESLLSICALVLLCGAVENEGRARTWRVLASGVLFGIYLCVRPAGIFVPAALAIAALIEPALAPFLATVLGIASAGFLASSGSIWARFTWLTLAGSLAVCLLAWALDVFWRKRGLPAALRLPAVATAAAAAIGILAAARPAVFAAMVETVGRYLPGSSAGSQSYSVGELIPIWAVPPYGVGSLYAALGTVWIPGLPVILYAVCTVWWSRRPVVVLCTVWTLVMTVAGVLQMRMWVYGGPALALATGLGCAWLMARLPRFQILISTSTAALLLLSSLPHAIAMSRQDGGPRPEWHKALAWFRSNTPEPLGDPRAWLRYWPALPPGETFAYPPSAYSVLTWWDYGDWVNAIGHRIPSTNGTQENAGTVAAFLTASSPEAARALAAQLRARYAVLNSEVTGELWPGILQWSNHSGGRYEKRIWDSGPHGERIPLTIYLPDYYRTMAVRIYNFDGKAITPSGVSVFVTKRVFDGTGMVEALDSEQKFPSEEKAREYRLQHPEKSMIFGSSNPMASCVEVEALPWVKRIFASPGPPGPQTVKVFELAPPTSD